MQNTKPLHKTRNARIFFKKSIVNNAEPNAKYPYQSIPGGEEMLDRIADWVRTMYPQKKVTPKVDWGWFAGLVVVPIILLLEIRRRMKNAK
jgi:hypothetical protein